MDSRVILRRACSLTTEVYSGYGTICSDVYGKKTDRFEEKNYINFHLVSLVNALLIRDYQENIRIFSFLFFYQFK